MSWTTEEAVAQATAEGWKLEEWGGLTMWWNPDHTHGLPVSLLADHFGPESCRECGSHSDVREGGLCFDCGFWMQQLDAPHGAYVGEDWTHFRDQLPRPGHGGLWCQGTVPERWRPRFSDRRDQTRLAAKLSPWLASELGVGS